MQVFGIKDCIGLKGLNLERLKSNIKQSNDPLKEKMQRNVIITIRWGEKELGL